MWMVASSQQQVGISVDMRCGFADSTRFEFHELVRVLSMPLGEVFPNPFVKKVLFQITFPNLFFLPNRIGEFQIKIMKQFPTSQLLIRRSMVFVDATDQETEEQLPKLHKQPEETSRVWQFVSDSGITLDVATGSLSLSSDNHRGYEPLRQTIEFVCRVFLELTEIPLVNRIGLRYINECPISGSTNEEFQKYYNSTFPLTRFALQDSVEMQCKVAVSRPPHILRLIETLRRRGDRCSLMLDIDAWSEGIDSSVVLDITDALHETIQSEFRTTIKEPALALMRQTPEVADETHPG